MEMIDHLIEKINERKNLYKDKLYKKKLMSKFGNTCPRCGRKLNEFSIHGDCYKKFIMLSKKKMSDKVFVQKNQKGICVFCKKQAGQKHLLCSFCGFYK